MPTYTNNGIIAVVLDEMGFASDILSEGVELFFQDWLVRPLPRYCYFGKMSVVYPVVCDEREALVKGDDVVMLKGDEIDYRYGFHRCDQAIFCATNKTLSSDH